MYGKVMSLPDHVIEDYFTLVTRVPAEELEEIRQQLQERSVNPMELKKRLAREIVGQYYSPEDAESAEAEFERVFQKREAPEESAIEVPWGELPFALAALPKGVVGMLPFPPPEKGAPVLLATLLSRSLGISMSEARRLQVQGAIDVDGKVVRAPTIELEPGSVIRVGKHRFLRIVDADKG
jgi:tyrosyl-tRNA synthetase